MVSSNNTLKIKRMHTDFFEYTSSVFKCEHTTYSKPTYRTVCSNELGRSFSSEAFAAQYTKNI